MFVPAQLEKLLPGEYSRLFHGLGRVSPVQHYGPQVGEGGPDTQHLDRKVESRLVGRSTLASWSWSPTTTMLALLSRAMYSQAAAVFVW